MSRREDQRKQQQTTKWYVHAYLHADRDDVLPLDERVLDGLQFGGKRNFGYGITQVKDTQIVDLEVLDYSRLEDSEAFILELVTPFVLESEYPSAADQDVRGGGKRAAAISVSEWKRSSSNERSTDSRLSTMGRS